MQRTLGSKSLAEGQKGIVLAASLKLLIPFVVVIPGILAYNLFSGDLLNPATGEYDYDRAFPVLVRNLIKPYPLISWFVLAALSGAVISSSPLAEFGFHDCHLRSLLQIQRRKESIKSSRWGVLLSCFL